MKKIMTSVLVLACAIGVQAASIDWSIGNYSWTLPDATTAPMGTTVYLINAGEWDSIKSAIDGGTTSFAKGDTGILDVASTANKKGNVARQTATSGDLVAGTVYDFAYLILNGDKYFASQAQSFAAYDPTHAEFYDPSFVQFAASDFTTNPLSGGWATPGGATPPVDIPEPTSGLLLLVGASLLALRRKQN